MLLSVLAVATGAALGAVLRWCTGIILNDIYPSIPPGTLFVNIAGGYAIGLALSYFADDPAIKSEWRLLIVTGFLGSLTTFSTFSMEVMNLIREGKIVLSGLSILTHVGGSLLATFLGILTYELFR